MRRLFVVYNTDDMPRAETESLEEAYDKARECISNDGGFVSIDIYEWENRLNLKWQCANGDFYFYKDWESIIPDDLAETWVAWYNLIDAHSKDELETCENLFRRCDIKLKDNLVDLYRKKWKKNS